VRNQQSRYYFNDFISEMLAESNQVFLHTCVL